jgi:hypothetical protein
VNQFDRFKLIIYFLASTPYFEEILQLNCKNQEVYCLDAMTGAGLGWLFDRIGAKIREAGESLLMLLTFVPHKVVLLISSTFSS